MASPKRTQGQIEVDRVEIARRYLKGELQSTIAEALSITQQQVSYDLARIREAWQRSALVDFSTVQAREMARIDLLEREYWIAWDRSCTPRHITKTGRTTGEEVKDTASITTEERDGNPVFLQGIQWCIEQRCRIFGLYEPEKFALVDWRREVEQHGANAGELFEQLVRQYTAALGAGTRADVERSLPGSAPASEN